MKLLLPTEYIAEATRQINHAQKRVSLLSFVVADHPSTHDLIEALIAAAKRGVTVSVAADIFTYGEVSGSFLPIRYFNKNSRAATSMARRLKSAGVQFHWLGGGRTTILNGRTHNKWCVVDDIVFSFGGVNIYEGGIENNDYMFELSDAHTADALHKEQHRIQAAERNASNYPSHRQHTDYGTILFDGGFGGQSTIYRRACELAKEAKDVLYVSQYCPNGRLARALKTKPYHLYFNRPEQATIFNKILIWFAMKKTGFRTEYLKDQYLHAKYMVFTMPDDSKIALTGSHNFSYTAVLFGTREMTLETKDPTVIAQLESFTKERVA